MSLDGAQVGALAAGLGSLVGGTSMAIVNGLFSRRGETHKATMETIVMLREGIREANAREREALERVDELEDNVRIHHDVIRVARYELSVLLLQDMPADTLHMLEKVRDKLDTRIR